MTTHRFFWVHSSYIKGNTNIKLPLMTIIQRWADEILRRLLFSFRRQRDREDRLNMLDAVSALETDSSQSLLADLILLSPKPNKDLVERLLIASSGFTRAISKVLYTSFNSMEVTCTYFVPLSSKIRSILSILRTSAQINSAEVFTLT